MNYYFLLTKKQDHFGCRFCQTEEDEKGWIETDETVIGRFPFEEANNEYAQTALKCFIALDEMQLGNPEQQITFLLAAAFGQGYQTCKSQMS